MMRLILTLCIVLAACDQAIAQEARDGNWWNAQSESVRTFYVLGFVDGVSAGYNEAGEVVAEESMATGDKCKSDPCIRDHVALVEQTLSDLPKREKRYVGVTVGQISGGVSSIYSDYRNLSIGIVDAEAVAMEAIRGASDDSIQKRLEYFRKHANEN